MADAAEISAVILPFPKRAAEPDGKARLAEALAKLGRALEEQKAAISAWRGATGELRESMQRLGGSLRGYQLELAELGGKVGTLNRSARNLQDWAEHVEGTASS